MDFRTALSRNRPPRRLGPVRLAYSDSCLLLDVAQRGRAAATSRALGWCGWGLGLGALGLLVQPDEATSSAAAALGLAATCVAGAAWLERPPGYHRWVLLFATEELVLERRGRPLRPAVAERLHFDQVTALSLEPEPGGRGQRLLLRYEDAEATPREAALLRHLEPADAAWTAELVSRLEQMLGITAGAARPARLPPSRTGAPGAPPARG